MKKLLLTAAVAVFAFSSAFAQSNEQGTISVNLLGGYTFGGNATDKIEGDGDQDYSFASASYGLNAHYGISEEISVGIGFTTGSYLLTEEAADLGSFAATMSLTNISAQGRYYFVNDADINVFGGVNLGYASANDKFGGFDISSEELKLNGLSYGINAGINYYIWGNVGGTISLGYDAASLSGDRTYEGETIDVKRSVGGVTLLAGLAFKFN